MQGVYYDGKSTGQYHCSLSVDTNSQVLLHDFTIEAPPNVAPVAIADVVVSARVGNTPRFVYFPGGGSFETEDQQAADQLNVQIRQAQGEAATHWFIPHRWESSFRLAVVAISVMLALIVFFAFVGIPGISGWVAEQLPAEVNNALGKGTLELLDERYFKKSELDLARQRQLEELFSELAPKDDGIDYQLYFRDGGTIGANAFALPNGQVVLTDALVTLADSDNEIRSILLHEIAHVVHRHTLKQLISTVSLFAIYGMMIGDLDTMNNVMVYLPVILIQTGYSRQDEWEADGYALNAMLASHISPKHFANIMRKLEKEKASTWFQQETEENETADNKPAEKDAKDDTEESTWLNYLSSHPVTQDRITRFENAAP